MFGWIIVVLNVVAAIVAVRMNWPTQFGRIGTDAGADVINTGTAISAPLPPIALIVLSIVRLRRTRGGWTVLALLCFCLSALAFVIGGLGEAFAPGTSDTPKAVLVIGGASASLIGLTMLALAAAAFKEL